MGGLRELEKVRLQVGGELGAEVGEVALEGVRELLEVRNRRC